MRLLQYAIAKVYDGTWDEIGGLATTLGAADDAVGLPTDEGSWRLETYTVEEYQAELESIKTGEQRGRCRLQQPPAGVFQPDPEHHLSHLHAKRGMEGRHPMVSPLRFSPLQGTKGQKLVFCRLTLYNCK